jgi:hypothetical protein
MFRKLRISVQSSIVLTSPLVRISSILLLPRRNPTRLR